MTVVELSPVELYGLFFVAMFNALMAVLIYRELRRANGVKELVMLWAGLAGIVGLPLAFGVGVLLKA